MGTIILLLGVAAAIMRLELPGLRARKRKREIAVFLVFLATGTALYAAMALHVKLPNPFLLIKLAYGGHA